jgi:5,10-methenyltetrahydrofolate synthetase
MNNGVRPTIFYYNPNIWPREEYEIRKNESKRHAESLCIRWIDGDYDHDGWCQHMKGLENEPERGSRCQECFVLRLTKTAQKARELGIPYFSTTLASSRWKSLEQINRAGMIAEQAANEFTQKEPSLLCKFWAQNWRKGGLQERRNQLLKEHQFYNQQYCGCEFSARNGANTKPLLRAQMREAKRQHQAQLPKMSEDVVERLRSFLSTIRYPLSTILAYWPLPDEVDIRPLIDQLVAEGKTVLLPKVTGDETIELRRYTSRVDLQEGAFHIMEPVGEPFTDYAQIDVCLVPGVAFDAAGHRLGRGKGYYDRFLSSLLTSHSSLLTSHSSLLIGICFPFQRVAEVPSEAHDVLMDEIVS